MVSTCAKFSLSFSLFLFLFALFLTSSATLAPSINLLSPNGNNVTIHSFSTSHHSRLVKHKLKFPLLNTSNSLFEHLCHHAGYYDLPNTKSARMFYFFFKSRVDNYDDPVVLWLSGGPGASGSIALFYENGPFRITDDLTLIWNDYGWDTVSNIIYVDQPTGTGFSYTTDDEDIRHDLTGVINDLYNFMQKFFDEYSDFVTNDFYITGNSYAGHYIPALASQILQENKNLERRHINLKGFGLGNGLVNAEIQISSIPQFAKLNGLIYEGTYKYIAQALVPKCKKFIKDCGLGDGEACLSAYDQYSEILEEIRRDAGNINFFDIRRSREAEFGYYDYSKMESFLNQESVQDALGVKDITFVPWKRRVIGELAGDYGKNYDKKIPHLLENRIKVLVFNGEMDLTCNWMGSLNWVKEMEWYGKKEFNESPLVDYNVDGEKVGDRINHGPLTFIKVLNSGHKVSRDQPKVAREMLTNWMKQKLE